MFRWQNKMRGLLAAAVVSGVAGLAGADSYRIPGMQMNDVFLTEIGLKQKLPGRVIEFANGARFHYYPDGRYVHEPSEGVTGATGHYSFAPKGMVCVRFDGGGGRCDTYVRSVKNTVMIDGGGRRHKIKSMIRE